MTRPGEIELDDIMTAGIGPKFDELRAEYASTAEEVEDYARTVRTVVLMRKLLMAIDAERQLAGWSKAELARRSGADPSVVRRLFSSQIRNPTLRTVVDMLSTLNIELELRPKQPRPQPIRPPRRLRRSRATVCPECEPQVVDKEG